MAVFKMLVWSGFAIAVAGLLAIFLNVAPYALAPFYLNWPTQTPGGIEGRMSDAEAKRRIKALRKITSSPQAAATSVDSLSVIGIKFDDASNGQDDAAASARQPKLSAPFPVTLDLSRSRRDGIVTIADKAIAWTLIPPPSNDPQAVFGLESRLFPTFKDAPRGVLAGFRIGAAGGNISKPLNPFDASSGDVRKFCRSLAEWANYFSVPIDKVSYMLVASPDNLTFDGRGWTTEGRVILQLDNSDLHEGCGQSYAEAWRQ